MAVPSSDELQLLLQQFLEANNESRLAAEKHLAKFLKQKASVEALLKQMAGSGYPGVRQLSAILLRKKISVHWKRLNATDQQALEELLLQRLLEEPEKLVQTAVAHLISVVGKLTIPHGQWNALLPFLLQCTQSSDPRHREIAMILFYALTDTVSEQMHPYLSTLVDIFLGGLGDSHLPVRMATLRAVVPVAALANKEAEFKVFFKLVQPIMEVMKQCIQMHQETEEEQYLDVVLQVFDVLEDLSHIDLEGVGQVLPVLLEYMLSIAGNNKTLGLVRERATTFLGNVAMARPGAIVKQNMVDPLLLLSLSILAEQYDEELFDDDHMYEADDDGSSALHFASQLLDCLSCSLPNSRIYPTCFGWCKAQILEGAGSPPTIKAALLAISLICKGCRDPMRKECTTVLEMINRSLASPEMRVREAAAVAISQIVEYLQPEILDKYADFLPGVFKSLDDPSPKVREKSVFTLESIAENLGDQIKPHLPQLMERLLLLLNQADSAGQRICLSSISAIVDGVGEAFVEYAPHVLGILRQVMSSEAQDHLALRAKATECVGVIAASIGKERFHPYFEAFFPLVMRGFDFDCTELTELSFVCLKNFAEVYDEEWAAQLPVVMPPVVAAMTEDHGEMRSSKSVFGAANVDLPDISSEEDDEDVEVVEGGAHRVFRVRVADMEKKAAAIHALGIFAKVTRSHFQPYLETSVDKLLELMNYFHEGVRENVIFALRHLLTVAYCLFPPSAPWKKGIPITDTIHPECRQALDTTMNLFLEHAMTEDSKEVVKIICDSIAEIAKEMGPVAVHPYIGEVKELLLSLMRQEGFCQTLNDEEELPSEDDQDHDQILMDAVFETVDELAKVYAEGFAGFWPELLDVVLVYLNPKRNASDHAMALGTLAEVANAMGEATQPFFQKMFPVMLRMLQSDDGGTRSNAAYGVGVMCQNCTLQATLQFGAVLQGLRPLMDLGSNPANCVDNACGAVARMMNANLEACHFEHVFPVLLERLPLRQDWQENPVVYGTLCSLLVRIPDMIRPYLPRVLSLLAHALQAPEVQPEVKTGVANSLKGLLQSDEAVRQAATTLPEEGQAVLRAVIS